MILGQLRGIEGRLLGSSFHAVLGLFTDFGFPQSSFIVCRS